MGLIVFVQLAAPALPLAALLNNARKYFEASLEVLGAAPPAEGLPDADAILQAQIELASARYGYSGRFVVTARGANESDWRRADVAEIRGQAANMAALARRCASVWQVEPQAPESEAATHNLCAIMASVALGPVLPPDDSTLFGVRGAMERVERLVRSE